MTQEEGREKKEKGKGKGKAMFRNKPIILTDWRGGCSIRIVKPYFPVTKDPRTFIVSVRVMQEPHVLETEHNQNICFVSKGRYSSFADA